MNILDPKSEAGQRMVRNAAFEKPTTAGDAPVEEWTRQRIEAALKGGVNPPHITVDDGLWLLERCRPLHAGAEPEALVEQRVIGHGEGQEHTIADVNAGRVDDLIGPRLAEAFRAGYEAALSSSRTAPEGPEKKT